MRLVSIQLHGYKRFADKNTLNVDGPVVAIVGPNEAGKTSLLEGLLHLNGSPVFDPSEFTRDHQPPKFAYRVLEAQAAGNSIVERRRRATLKSAYERIRKALDLEE